MTMQKFYADESYVQADGGVVWTTRMLGCLAKIQNCRIDGTDLRRTVYITGEAVAYFAQPAATRVKGRYVKGFVTRDDDGNLVFHPMDSHKHLCEG